MLSGLNSQLFAFICFQFCQIQINTAFASDDVYCTRKRVKISTSIGKVMFHLGHSYITVPLYLKKILSLCHLMYRLD